MTQARQPANQRPAIIGLIRRAVDALPTGDPTDVARAVRHHLGDLPRRDRLRFTTQLAWTAGFIAAHLPAEQRADLFRRLELPDQQLGAETLARFIAGTAL